MSSLRSIALAGVIVSVAAVSSAATAAALDPHRFRGSKPNVIIMFADDYGACMTIRRAQ